jgi:hypothetical protein
MERRWAFLGQKAPGFFAGWRGDGRDGGQPLGERRAIHASAAANDGQPPRRVGFFHRRQRRIAPPGNRSGLSRRAHAVKQMRRAGFICCAWARGDEMKLPVKLHAVGIDDGAAEALRNFKR